MQERERQPPTEIDSCTTINDPGRYVLTTDIEDSDANVCIDIQSSEVYFDANGHTIDGARTDEVLNESAQGPIPSPTSVAVGVGVDVPGSLSNVTVTDVTATRSVFGVYATDLTDLRVENTTASTNGYGIFVNNSSDSTVAHTAALDNFADGIDVNSLRGRQVTGITVTDSVALRNRYEGIAVWNASHSVVADSVAAENGEVGVLFESETQRASVNNTGANVTARANGYLGYKDGIGIFHASDSLVTNSTAVNNSGTGIAFDALDETVSNNTVVDSTATENSGGVLVINSTDTMVANVTASKNVLGILSVDRIDGLVITENTVDDNEFIGLIVDGGAGVAVTDNTVRNSGYVGINFANTEKALLAGNEVTGTRGDASFDVPFPAAGILLSNVSTSGVVDNTASENNVSGVLMREGNENLILLSNRASGNADDGVTVNASESIALILTTANNNGDDGIEVTASNRILLVGNTLDGNGDLAVEINESENVIRRGPPGWS
ncbi:right-handed parallel beta-helix repeat-containing protein [Halorussus halophilus]|uniref:right-handed parallel beta-helix repeat-containing protein n=1 Tax=Halorussus halophilus TaxID=2650975 RepID=UPI001787F6E2|nr:right-handed parallel beta-helix repeat-containing protein [Halorussus halophilus]